LSKAIFSDFYSTIEAESVAEFKDRGSRFIAVAFPINSVEDFKLRLKLLKEEHPKAVHHCFAYRIGVDGNVFRISDDGEPGGTAGRPILGQIDSKLLSNIAIVVVRYFGGTLLGVPGLIHAYKMSSSMALQTTAIVQKAIEINYHLIFDYTVMNEVMTVIKKYNCTLTKQELQLFCVMDLGIPVSNLELCLLRLKEIRGLEVNKC
jgi:uncharacterized YigZ family protein